MQAVAGTMLVLCNMAVRQCEGFIAGSGRHNAGSVCEVLSVIWQSGSVRGFIAGSGRHNAGSV